MESLCGAFQRIPIVREGEREREKQRGHIYEGKRDDNGGGEEDEEDNERNQENGEETEKEEANEENDVKETDEY